MKFTLFACPKTFTGKTATIQRNAIASWIRLKGCEVLLLGDDKGVEEAGAEFGVKCISDVEKNKFGTPLVSSLFVKARENASHDVMAYLNADIIVGQDFADAIDRCVCLEHFLLAGRRWDLDVSELVDFGDPMWHEHLIRKKDESGRLHAVVGLDFFVFPRGCFSSLPPFVVGRPGWDNWLLYSAWAAGLSLVDLTECVTVIHQNHDYGHIPNGRGEAWNGPEADENIALAKNDLFDLLDCNWMLTTKGLEAARDRLHVLRRMERLHQYRPLLWRRLLSWKLRYLYCWAFPSIPCHACPK